MAKLISGFARRATTLLAGAVLLGLVFSAGNALADPEQGKERPGASPGPPVAASKDKPSGPRAQAATNFTSLNASGGVCVGSAACDAAYFAAFGDLEVTDTLFTNPRLFLATDGHQNSGVPAVQWILQHLSGAFRITDRFTTTPLTIEQGAPTNALYLDSTGNIGVGTSAPATLLHLDEQIFASLRLRIQALNDRTDLWQGETGLWFENVLNGGTATSMVKFQNGAPDNSLVVDNTGFIGLGTDVPATKLHMRQLGNSTMRMESSSGGGAALDFTAGPGATAFGTITNHPIIVVANSQERLRITPGGNLGINQPAPAHPIHHFNGAFLSAGGAWTDVSSASVKGNFEAVDTSEILEKLAQLPVQSWSYNAEDASVRHIGPTAEDFHATFGLGVDDKAISALDMNGVNAAALKGLYSIVKEKEQRIASLEARLAALENGGAAAPSAAASQAAGGASTSSWAVAVVAALVGAAVAGACGMGLKKGRRPA